MRVPINPPLNITQGFGVPEVGSAFGLHSGIDYAAANGTPVYACISGDVSTVSNDQYHGNVVDIANGGKWYRVMHLQKFVVTSGHVNEGDLIAYSNNTGFSTGPHVHWDVRTQYNPTSFAAFINPLDILNNQGDDMSTIGDTEARILIKHIYGYTNELDIEGAIPALVGGESNTVIRRMDAAPTAAAYQKQIADWQKAAQNPPNPNSAVLKPGNYTVV